MRFLIDAQLPPALVHWLTARGREATHVGGLGMQAASDRVIWDCALTQAWIIVTKDEDFAQRKLLTRPGPTVVWVRWPNTRRQQLLVRFETALPMIVAALARGETLIEIV